MNRRLVLATVLVSFVAGCNADAQNPSTAGPPAVQPPITLTVDDGVTPVVVAGGPTVVQVGSVTVEIPAGALALDSTVTAAAATLGSGQVPGFTPAGAGVDVDITGSTLGAPAVVTFEVGASPEGEVPVSLHVADDGSWAFLPALYDGGRLVISTDEFSAQIPGWLNPIRAAEFLVGGASHLFGLRTSPPECTTPPAWAQFNGTSLSAIHACMSTNPDGIPELVIRSNRSYWMQITVPEPTRWVWTSNMHPIVNQVAFGPDSGHYLLPPGETMTIGLEQPLGAARDLNVMVERNNFTIALSTVALFLGDISQIGDLYTVVRCGYDGFGTRDGWAPSVKKLVDCAIGVFSGFESTDVAVKAVVETLGEDALTDPELAAKLDTIVGRLKGLGKVAAIVSAAFIVIGAVEMFGDELYETLTGNNNVTAHLAATDESQPQVSVAPTDPPQVDTPPTAGSLGVVFTENPFRCDGQGRGFGRITGALPGETVSFWSAQVADLSAGAADAAGELPIRWLCDPQEAGQNWELTATGNTSGRTLTFIVTGG